jgi:tricorn protease
MPAPRSVLAAALLATLCFVPPALAAPTLMLRSPDVSSEHVVFAWAQNIWLAPRAGGAARPLTMFQGLASGPRFSPDGKWVAFSGQYAGNLDVYVVPVTGGIPKRLTWHPSDDLVQDWTPDGKSVLFASERGAWAPSPTWRFYSVPAAGGTEEPFVLPRAFQGRLSPDGKQVAYRMNDSWDEERRNYRGGQNRPIWITDLASLETVTPPWTDSKDMEPAWIGGRVCFLSDRDGVSNVWSWDPATKDLKQLTRFTDFDVKTLESGAGVLVFEQAGRLHELDPALGTSKVLEITAEGDLPWMLPQWAEANRWISSVALSPTGKRALLEARGEIFTIPAEKGDVRNLTRSSGSAERAPAWSPDGKWVSYISDRSGEYQLVVESPDGISTPRTIPLRGKGLYYTVTWSPDSKKLTYHDTDMNVWVLDVTTGKARAVGREPWMVPQRTLFPSWSPDSRWVSYAARLNSLFRAVFITNVETGESHQVTDALADAAYPVWDASGKYLWFLASTDLGLRSQWLDMTTYDRQANYGLYMAVLAKGEPSPLLPESDEDKGLEPSVAKSEGDAAKSGGAAKGTKAGADKGAKSTAGVAPVKIDFDGLQQRVVAVGGVSEKPYAFLKAGATGVVFMLETPAGMGGGPPAAGTVHRYKLTERKSETFVSGVAEYAVSADGKKLFYRTPAPPLPGGKPPENPPKLFLVDADKAAPKPGEGELKPELRMWLDPAAEFQQIFAEGWRNQRDYFYVPNLHGADWPKVREMYGAFLPHVKHREDLNYLLDMMGGETAVGHSYVYGGATPDVPKVEGGLLGADFAVESGRYRIRRIYDNESWNPELKAPLSGPGIAVREGQYIVAVNGEELRAPDNLHRLLDGTAGKQTVLEVNDRPARDGAKQVTVVPVATEQALRTRAWVEANRRKVDQLSGGKLAYVFLPNTGGPGYRSFNRYYFSQQDRDGVIVDERYNGGGSAADYMIEVLGRRFDGYFNNVAGDRRPFTSPAAGIWGPKIMIVNEMSGSGGDYLPYMFRHRGLGTIVGKRTWGGLVHTADTPRFVDGGAMIAPRGGYFTEDGRWAVENEGVTPDVDVENWPKDVVAGRDPQLERAVEEGMRQLKEKPVKRMTQEPPPPTTGKRRTAAAH